MQKEFEKEETDILENLKRKKRVKRTASILIVLILLVIVGVFIVLLLTYFKSPMHQLGIGANIEDVLLSPDFQDVYVKLLGGSDKNITKIKFIFTDFLGEEHYYETTEGAVEISVAFERSFWDWLFRRQFTGVYDYEISADELNLDNFENINEVSVSFEYKTEEGEVIETDVLDTTQMTTKTTTTGGGGGNGDDGGTCTTGVWANTEEYRCNNVNNTIREIKQIRTVCGTEASEQWIVDECAENYTCYDGEGAPADKCINETKICVDSDEIDYYAQGNVTLNEIDYVFDACEGGNLTEYYCYYNSTINETRFEIRNQSFNCSLGCLGGACIAPECLENEDCDDNVSCTDDVCNLGVCENNVNDSGCNDGAYCNGEEFCDAVLGCQDGAAPDANDSVRCTIDICDEVNEVIVNIPNNSACDDGLYCTGTETCDAILDCQNGIPVVCDDGILCTSDSCSELLEDCSFDTSGCYCLAEGPAPVECDDGNICTDDLCTSSLICNNIPNADSCDDSDGCTGNDICSGGVCSGTLIVCDDFNECTSDSCDSVLGCQYNPITSGTFCSGGVCDGNGNCIPCTPDCSGKECGDDGCGESCGSCGAGYYCSGGGCVEGQVYYVSPTGGGTSCLSSSPCLLSYAKSIVQSEDTIILMNGSYGEFTENIDRVGWITLKSENQYQAIFSRINMGDYSDPKTDAYLIFDGITVQNGINFPYTNYVQIKNSNIKTTPVSYTGNYAPYYIPNTYGISGRNSNYITIENNELSEAYRGIALSGDNWVIRNNKIHYLGEDGINSGSGNAIVDGNMIYDSDYRRTTLDIYGMLSGTFSEGDAVTQDGTGAQGIAYNYVNGYLQVWWTNDISFTTTGTVRGPSGTVSSLIRIDTAHIDGMHFEGGMGNIIINNNTLRDVSYQGISLYGREIMKNATISNNLVYGEGGKSIIISGVDDIDIYNNTAIGSYVRFEESTEHLFDSVINNMYNNIFSRLIIDNDVNGKSINVINHGNNIFGNSPSKGGLYPFTPVNSEVINANVQFKDAVNGDYHPLAEQSFTNVGGQQVNPCTMSLTGSYVGALPCVSVSPPGAIIIDHTAVDLFNQIPDYWIEEAKKLTVIHLGQSHGRQVPYGLMDIETDIDAKYNVDVIAGGATGNNNGALRILRSYFQSNGFWSGVASTDTDDYWEEILGTGGIDVSNVRRTLDYYKANGVKIDAILHTWSWDFVTSYNPARINDYLTALETLEIEYPDVTFIYMTDTQDRTGDQGYNVWRSNEYIRDYVRNNNKVLFDYGELEAWSADGANQNTYYHAGSGLNIPSCYLFYWNCEGGWGYTGPTGEGGSHINKAGTTMKGKAFWYMIARLAGWDGITICIDNDNDGYNITGGVCGAVDCNDNNISINPGETEICNGIDDNCVNGIDEGVCPICPEGQITSRCFCGGASYETGYCCSGVYQTTECGVPEKTYSDSFDNANGIAEYNEVAISGGSVTLSGGSDYSTDPDLVSIYLFENSGNLGQDFKNNNHMAQYSTIALPIQSLDVPTGFTGNSASFDGASTLCDSSSSFNPSQSHTLCWWARPNTFAGDQFAQFTNYDTWVQSNGLYRWATRNLANTAFNNLDVSSTYTLGTWVYICNKYDVPTLTKTVYVNGALRGTQTVDGIRYLSTTRWCLGSFGGGGYFNGLIYQPMWFNRILTDTEVNALYTNNYFGSGAGKGNFTSVVIPTTNSVIEIINIIWTESNTDINNNISVQVSVDNVNWYNVNNGGNLVEGSFTPGNSLVYRVFFNSADKTISMNDISIKWIEETGMGSFSPFTKLWNFLKSILTGKTGKAILTGKITGNDVGDGKGESKIPYALLSLFVVIILIIVIVIVKIKSSKKRTSGKRIGRR